MQCIESLLFRME